VSFDLAVPVIAAPMAGGSSTPGLVAAVNAAGGLGFLAAGYRSAGAMTEQIHRTRELTDRPFGVNLFVPAEPADPVVVAAYRERLLPEAERYGVALPAAIAPDRDDWDAKLAALIADPVPYVSYTFGLPTAEEVAAVRAAGVRQIGTVTTPREARAAAALGLDALTVQGPEAGGHRATHRAEDEPGTVPLLELLTAVRAETALPLIAAGGLMDGADIARALAAGRTPSSSAPRCCAPTSPARPSRTGGRCWSRPAPRSPRRSPAAPHAACATPSSTATSRTRRPATPRCTTSPSRCAAPPPPAATWTPCTCGPAPATGSPAPGRRPTWSARCGARLGPTGLSPVRTGSGRSSPAGTPAGCAAR